MKSKRLLQTLVLLALLFSPMGSSQLVYATDLLDVEIVQHDLVHWDGSYGYVNSVRYENWRFTLAESVRHFGAGVTPMEGDLVPVVALLDANGDELLRGGHIFVSSLPPGNYSLQVQPQTGGGLYVLTVEAELWEQPITSVTVSQASMLAGETTMVTVSLENVPPEGFTSAEFTCYYSENLLEPADIVVLDRFGPDPVVVVSTPEADRFIVAIAGSHDYKATTDGAVLTFGVRGLQPGQARLGCFARVSRGDNVLAAIEGQGGNVTVLENPLTPTADPVFCDKAEFVADITVPPGSLILPGTIFTKTWRLKNVGMCTWTTAYQLVFYDGTPLGAPTSVDFAASVEPGEMVDISLNMTAPSSIGPYRGDWLFRNASGHLFGAGPRADQTWFVDIMVSGPTLTPSETPTPTVTPGQPSPTVTPSLTPSGSTPTPMPNIVYDFVVQAPSAFWYSGAGLLPYPGIDGSLNGFAFKVDYPRLETGTNNNRPALLMVPQDAQNGYIQGYYPPFLVQAGDHFRATVSCEGGATDCYAVYRFNYQVGSEPVRTFWGPWIEREDGNIYTADVDLSPLAGKSVKFILTVLASGGASGDRMLWVDPVIYRTSAATSATPTPGGPTLTPSLTSSPTLTATATEAPVEQGFVSGQVLAGKPVKVDVYDANNVFLGSIDAAENGLLGSGLIPGRYSLVARAGGYLSAQASIDLTLSGVTMPTISLLAGDVDGNNVIDPYDALTIGMNYNTALPSAADLNNDGIINVLDLEVLARNYRKTGPVPWLG